MFRITTVAIIGALMVVGTSSCAHHAQPVQTAVEACGLARFDLDQAIDKANVSHYRDAYADSLRGLEATKSCKDRTAGLVDEGFLLSMKAMTEHFVTHEDYSRDLDRAQALLERCRKMESKVGLAMSARCEAQEQQNDVIRSQFETHSMTIP